MLAFNAPVVSPPPLAAADLARPAASAAAVANLYRKMNKRNRQQLMVTSLVRRLTIKPSAADPDIVVLREGTTKRVTLSVNRTDVPFWQNQISDLLAQKWHRDDRMAEIVLQQTDMISFLSIALPIGPHSHPWLLTLVDALMEVAFRIEVEFKHLLPMPRPNKLNTDIAPVIQTPGHSSFPSGHATEAFSAATLLGLLFPSRAENLRRMAMRIAVNRGYAGMHFPADHLAGAVLGEIVGSIVAERVFGVSAVASNPSLRFHAGTVLPASALTVRTIEEYVQNGGGIVVPLPPLTRPANPQTILEWIAAEVLDERGF